MNCQSCGTSLITEAEIELELCNICSRMLLLDEPDYRHPLLPPSIDFNLAEAEEE